MRNNFILGVVGFFVLLGACASQHASNHNVDEQVDLYLSTLDDKHFVWCELDLEQCRRDFEAWKRTKQGLSIIKEFERENTDQPDNTQHLPNVFRTRFVEEGQLEEEMVGKDGKGQSIDRDPDGLGRFYWTTDNNGNNGHTIQEGMSMAPSIYGPQSPR
ncbi:hypothetical protein ACTRXD_05195 [Nitrospira sp. T9]|uniref:hypothetical protein n=1 Tax=unclassified Nitrospira TaxID=2652172 RepID=UPI003F9B5DC1